MVISSAPVVVAAVVNDIVDVAVVVAAVVNDVVFVAGVVAAVVNDVVVVAVVGQKKPPGEELNSPKR